MTVEPDIDAARRVLLADYSETIESVIQCADAVASRWDDPATAERATVTEAMTAELRCRDLLPSLVDLLVEAVAAAGCELQATPVPASPYVVVPSTGPVLRATVENGRIVVALRVFAVSVDATPRYQREGHDPASVLAVQFYE